MPEDEFENLVDAAAQEVFDMLPSEHLTHLSSDDREELFANINEALTPLLREALNVE